MKKLKVLVIGLILLSCGVVVEGGQIIKRGKMMKPENKKAPSAVVSTARDLVPSEPATIYYTTNGAEPITR